jgi:FMN-dependent oxidoreductase (nitrilotriacetate monooxygenase family)
VPRQLHLLANFNPGIGYHPARWRAQDPRAFFSLDQYIRSAQAAERAKFDAVFLSDVLAVHPNPPVRPWHVIEPSVANGAIASHTRNIGLVTTLSTSFEQPYTVARRIASIDHLSQGRAGWNIVTSIAAAAAGHFGFDRLPDHDARYARAHEFVDAVLQLWDSWEDDALVLDPATGEFVDPGKVHPVDIRGEHLSVRGLLQVPRPPQGHPVLVQAGTSPQGIELGTRYADLLFLANSLLEHAQAQYAHMKERVAAHGRDPEQVKYLPSVYPIVGATEAEAHAIRAELDALRNWENDVEETARDLGVSFTVADLDKPLGPLLVNRGVEHDLASGVRANAWRFAEVRAENTLRDFVVRGGTGHRQIIGAPEQIAADLEEWFVGRAADGFNVSFTHFPDQLELFGEHVVPILQRRGLFRTEYEGTTFREHLGLHRPANLQRTGAAS